MQIMIFVLIAMLASDLPDPILTFVRTPAFDTRVVQVEAGTLWNGKQMDFWFKRTVATNKAKAVWWTDTVRCPVSRSILIAAEGLEPPKVFTGANANEIIVTADGVGYSLRAMSQYPGYGVGNIQISSNKGTPLARWVDGSLRILDSCWSKTAPRARP